ncbi:nucleoside triphosphate pyrophosphohydrolase [Desulfococcaceae bacterium OttesenSCG-928-F15]|nr:nucleoside triphosphate pyrophosphohydrolase [Desulfococcaceae bacterium OttesenSCG-928-F15]
MNAYSLRPLYDILEKLKGENGCPWDKKQTPFSVISYLLEESYELKDAIREKGDEAVCEELGDALFQLLFLIFLFEEKGSFSFDDVLAGICAKLVRRHPHVFGDENLDTAEAVDRRWKEIKEEERMGTEETSILAKIVKSRPALDLAMEVSEKAAAVGFDWKDEAGVWEKVEEEMAEFRNSLERDDAEASAMEFGDLLFTLVNVARFRKIHPENALRNMVEKFISRFRYMEESLGHEGKRPEQASQEELEILWQRAKRVFGD